MIRVADVVAGSIADSLGLLPGSSVMSINGSPVRDSLDLLFLQADERLEVEAFGPDGGPLLFEIEKDPDEVLGLVPTPDKIRRCTNACPFCFVKGNPKADKLRTSLYIKDDDYRLSFLYGHYVTLTNLRDEDWDRIDEQRLSPLYVSVHATEPEIRRKMLINPRSAEIDAQLDRLQAARIRFHAQVVLCPELNDGIHLQRTIDDLWERGPDVLSLSVVPVGLTDYNAHRGIRSLTPEECERTLAQIDAARSRAMAEREKGWCYGADELFLQAGAEPPGPAYFDDRELVANGVGAISTLEAAVRGHLNALPRLDGRRVVLVTGRSAGPTVAGLAKEIAQASGAEVTTAVRENTLYGPLVTAVGLLSGRDHLEALAPYADYELALVSRSALNDAELFLDDLSLNDLRNAYPELEICPSDHITDALIPA